MKDSTSEKGTGSVEDPFLIEVKEERIELFYFLADDGVGAVTTKDEELAVTEEFLIIDL